MKLKKLLRKTSLNKQTQNTTYKIKKKDLPFIAQLLSKGYSITQTLEIVGNYDEIIKELMKGNSINKYLNIESNHSFYKTLSYFMKISSLDKAILSSIEYENSKKELYKYLYKEIAYPLLTLLFALFVYIFFNIYIYPQLSSFINQQMNSNINLILNIILLFILFILLLFISYMFIKDKEIFRHIYKEYLGNIPIVKDIFTYDFSYHYYLLIKQGYTTKQVFDLLLLLKKNTIFNINIELFIENLKKGISFNEIIETHKYFDHKFISFFKIGYYTQNLENILYDYYLYQKNKLHNYLKKFTIFITTFSYMMIALLIVSIYQMLLMPIEMIQNF